VIGLILAVFLVPMAIGGIMFYEDGRTDREWAAKRRELARQEKEMYR